MRWIEGDACGVFHPLNGYEDGANVIADMLRYAAGPGFPGPDGSPPDPSKAVARLERWRIPLTGASASFTTERLDQQASEYPRLDERYTATQHRYGYFATTPSETGRAAMFDRLARVDFNHPRIERFSLPAGDFASEPVFVPRSAHGAEGDGYLLAVVYRGREQRSDLIVLDAPHIEAGPLATAHLETRVPFGFHGNWLPQAA